KFKPRIKLNHNIMVLSVPYASRFSFEVNSCARMQMFKTEVILVYKIRERGKTTAVVNVTTTPTCRCCCNKSLKNLRFIHVAK
ncbi:MAG: hypothetical protein MI923_11180, partial [Phycisphaerales bacterium]|nr:hypothetical protein [Phycisphaerales bacterium]